MRRVVWYARAGGIARSGPHATQVEAARATIGHDGLPLEGAFVWPEEATPKPKHHRPR